MSLHQLSFPLGYSATTLWTSNAHSPGFLESRQASVFCIWKGCTAIPHPVSAKCQHPFFPMKHHGEEKTRNPDLPPEGHLWQHDSSHTPRDRIRNFWTGQQQSLCHTEPGPAHTKLRSFRIFPTPCPVFVFSTYLRLHQVRKLWSPCFWNCSAQRFGCLGPAHTHQPRDSGLNTNKKQWRQKKKKTFKLVCTKTFQEASFVKGLKSIEQCSCYNYSLIVQDRSTGCNGKRGRRPNSFLT